MTNKNTNKKHSKVLDARDALSAAYAGKRLPMNHGGVRIPRKGSDARRIMQRNKIIESLTGFYLSQTYGAEAELVEAPNGAGRFPSLAVDNSNGVVTPVEVKSFVRSRGNGNPNKFDIVTQERLFDSPETTRLYFSTHFIVWDLSENKDGSYTVNDVYAKRIADFATIDKRGFNWQASAANGNRLRPTAGWENRSVSVSDSLDALNKENPYFAKHLKANKHRPISFD